MLIAIVRTILVITITTLMAAQTSLAADAISGGLNGRVEYTLKTVRKSDPVLGGPRDKVSISVWIPDGVKVARGGICNPFAKGDDVSKHWRAACRHWQFAYVQVDFDGVKKDEFDLLTKGLTDLATKLEHPELEHLPLCFTGMSRGGGMSMQLAEMIPQRTIASAPVCLEVGPGSEATRRIPVMTVFGEKDGSQMERLLTKLAAERQQGARFGIVVQWNRKHEFALANNMSFVFFDDVQSRRLPSQPVTKTTTSLADIPLTDGWLGDVGSWSKTGTLPTIAAWADFKGNRDAACWFPTKRSAAVWQAFVGATKDVTISEPPGLGDKQPFGLHSAAKPVTVKLAIADSLKPQRVVLWDADQRLAEKSEAPWTFEVSFKAGIHSLIATVEGDMRNSSRPHTIVVGE